MKGNSFLSVVLDKLEHVSNYPMEDRTEVLIIMVLQNMIIALEPDQIEFLLTVYQSYK